MKPIIESETKHNVLRKSIRRAFTVMVASAALTGACSGDDGGYDGGCADFGVYAQNRWQPLGTAVREEPDVLSEKLEPGFAPNEVIAVDGWYDTGEPVYPTNPAPWNSGVWFRLANRDGWVSFAGVRGAPTEPDLTLHSPEGGMPAPTTEDCELTSNN